MNRRIKSDWSTYLGETDREVLQRYLEEENSVSLATGLAEVWITLPDNQKCWHKMDTGVLCFIKDYNFRSYYFRLFSLDFCIESTKPELVWEQELSFPFNYNNVTSKFHYFGTDFGYASFNFMFEDEARKVLQVVRNKISDKKYQKLKMEQNTEVIDLHDSSLGSKPPTSPFQTLVNSTAQIGSPVRDSSKMNSSTPLRKMKSTLTRSLSHSGFVNFIKTKVGRKKGIDKSQIGLPTDLRLVEHAELDSKYEKRFKNILVELNLSSKNETPLFDLDTSSQHDETFNEQASSGLKLPPGAGKRFAPPPPPRVADPNDLAAYLGKKVLQAPFPSVLTPPVSPELLAESRTTTQDETLRHCSLSPIERAQSLNQIVLSSPDEHEINGAPRPNDPTPDFNHKIGFKGFTNKVYLTPKLKAVYDPSFVSPSAGSDLDETGSFLLNKLRAELLRQAPYLRCNSDEED